MEEPTRQYRDVARLFRELARPGGGSEGVSRPAHPDEISAAESALRCRLPDSYRWFQLEFGDFADGPLDIYTVVSTPPTALNIVSINLDARENLFPRLPAHLIAFSDNGGGDYACFDTSVAGSGEHPVVWWNHEDDEQQKPVPEGSSFVEWLGAVLREIRGETRLAPLRRIADVIRVVGVFARDVLRARRG